MDVLTDKTCPQITLEQRLKTVYFKVIFLTLNSLLFTGLDYLQHFLKLSFDEDEY